jgi:peptidyl-prolyl cis-trans isomerase C
MRHSLTAMLVAATALVTMPALAEDAAKPAVAAVEPAKDYTILKVDGDDIRSAEVQEIWKGLFQGTQGGQTPDFNSFDESIRQNVLRGLVSERLIYKEAVKAGADKDPEVKKRLAALEKQVIMQSFMEKKAKELVTEEQLKELYNQKAAESKNQEEIKARHILVASEAEAKKIADQIKKGGDFEKIAKEKSTDKSSGAKGGELGWFTKDKMVPEFGEAAFKLKKGETSEPVKSAFGWHVIQVEDRRPIQMASFEEMKDSLRGELTNKAVQGYVEGLLKNANIKYYSADGKEKDFNKSLAPAAGKTEGATEEKQ